MFKRKEFSILWVILCVIALLIYLVIYASENDKMVQIYLADTAIGSARAAPCRPIWPDSRLSWDGTQWISVSGVAAPNLRADSGGVEPVKPSSG